MLAIWAAVLREVPDVSMQPEDIDEEVSRRLQEHLETLCVKQEEEGIGQRETARSIYECCNEWIHSHTHGLNAVAHALSHYESFEEMPEEIRITRLGHAVRECVEILRREAAREAKRGHLHTFTRRASGWLPDGSSIQWNTEEERFEPVRWPLRAEQRQEPPERERILTYRTSTEMMLRRIRARADASGYQVKETKGFGCGANREDETWHLRLRIYDRDNGRERARLSIWQRGHLHGNTAVEEHTGEPALEPQLRRQITSYVQLAKSRTTS